MKGVVVSPTRGLRVREGGKLSRGRLVVGSEVRTARATAALPTRFSKVSVELLIMSLVNDAMLTVKVSVSGMDVLSVRLWLRATA